jgi:superfamily I DNA/RNA helicase
MAEGAARQPQVRTLAPKVREKLAPEAFFGLADDVLGASGRPPLESSHKAIVEVNDFDLVLQIVAGPGAGKTEVLVWRVLYELLVGAVDPARVMVTTFTRKAAQELSVRMVERTDGLLEAALAKGIAVDDPQVHDLRIGTIHSLCDELLTEFDVEHMEEGKEVIDEVETRLRFLQCRPYAFRENGKNLLNDLFDLPQLISLFRPPWSNYMGGLDRVDLSLAVINQHIETWLPRCSESGTPNGIETATGPPGLTEMLTTIQEKWATQLEENFTMDFALLLQRFLERQPNLEGSLEHVFVDEFQDTNPIQYAIHLAWPKSQGVKLTAVGDDDQALYRWRGSDIACFDNLEPDCAAAGLPYRRELLEVNNRSSGTIVDFAHSFREATVLASDSLDKTVVAAPGKDIGEPVRLVEGGWIPICEHVAAEIDALGAGRMLEIGEEAAPSVAILMASTSEVQSKKSNRPALDIRNALEARDLRIFNPRNKSAARLGSPVHDLLGLISYLIDPVTKGPAGKVSKSTGKRGLVGVWASNPEAEKAALAVSAPPPFRISNDHASIQKRTIKNDGGGIGVPGPTFGPLLSMLDQMRDDLVSRPEGQVKMSLGGLVARLLSMPPFRNCGYTVELFRQALFTQLLDANIAITRTKGKKSLENPMIPRRRADGKIIWPDQYWSMLGAFGQLVEAGGQDDLEVEAFSEDAISLLTYHQAKGLEFDHVYVAMTGKEVDPSSVLATMLFSGQSPKYKVVDDNPTTKDKTVLRSATADREREVYVAITRAKQHLTVLHAPDDERPMMALNEGIESLFAGKKAKRTGNVAIRRWSP